MQKENLKKKCMNSLKKKLPLANFKEFGKVIVGLI